MFCLETFFVTMGVAENIKLKKEDSRSVGADREFPG